MLRIYFILLDFVLEAKEPFKKVLRESVTLNYLKICKLDLYFLQLIQLNLLSLLNKNPC